jgi:hypothetical protein
MHNCGFILALIIVFVGAYAGMDSLPWNSQDISFGIDVNLHTQFPLKDGL